MRYVEFVTEMTTSSLIRCIENALNYFGGTPKEILFDNMPQVVNRCLREGRPHQLERELVPEFTSFADYYGFDIVLARIRRPQEKGKVERFVGYFKESFIPFLDKKTGHDLNELNDLARKWCDRVNANVHSTTGEKPFDRLPLELINANTDSIQELMRFSVGSISVSSSRETSPGCLNVGADRSGVYGAVVSR